MTERRAPYCAETERPQPAMKLESQCMAQCIRTYLQRATLGSFGTRTEPKGSGVVSLDFEVAHLHRLRSLEGVHGDAWLR
jgi:hypothetical protein